jgi:CheY-like chemotaxis protein
MRLQAVADAAEPASAHAAGVARMLRDTARAWNLVWRADVQPPQALPDKISRYDGVSTSPLPLTARPHSMDPQALPRPVLLVVDDEPDLRDLLGEYFTRHGFEVREAADAARARACVAESVPDVAILDVNMPGENGLSLARWLRDSHPGLGIVMLTTVGEAVDRVVGLELGADDYLPKPFEVRELLARVRAVLRRSRRRPHGASVSASARSISTGGVCSMPMARRSKSAPPSTTCSRCSRAIRTGR